MNFKGMICAVLGSVGGAITAVFGGWSFGLTALLILMGIDYISGLVVAGVFHKSPKTQNGMIESHAGLKGLIRKFFVVCLVVAAHLIDRLIGTEYLRDAVTIAFCVNEIISLFENAGLMGVPLPKALVKALEVLKQKAGEDKAESDGGTDCHANAAALARNDATEEEDSSLRSE